MGREVDRRYVAALLVVYLGGLALVVTQPWGWELNRLTVRLYTFFRTDVPLAPDRLGPEPYGVLLNLLLFLPFGVLLTLALRRPWWTTVAALVVSTLIELAQWRWLERDGGWADVVANTCGALVGAVVVSWWWRARARPAPRPERVRHR